MAGSAHGTSVCAWEMRRRQVKSNVAPALSIHLYLLILRALCEGATRKAPLPKTTAGFATSGAGGLHIRFS